MIEETELFSGKILIADNKVNVLEITTPGRVLTDIEQLVKARNLIDRHIKLFERDDEKRRK